MSTTDKIKRAFWATEPAPTTMPVRVDREKQAAIEQRGHEEAEKVDGVHEGPEVSLADLAVGGIARDKFGNPKLTRDGHVIEHVREQAIPDTISGPELAAMLGVAPAAPELSPSPESIFAAEAKKAEEARWRDSILDRFDRLAAKKDGE